MLKRKMYVVSCNAEAQIYEKTGAKTPTPYVYSTLRLKDFGGVFEDLVINEVGSGISDQYPIGSAVNVILEPISATADSPVLSSAGA